MKKILGVALVSAILAVVCMIGVGALTSGDEVEEPTTPENPNENNNSNDNDETVDGNGIDYSKGDVIIRDIGGFSINLTKETITLGWEIVAYSIDGGAKWKVAKGDTFTTKFSKLLDKDLTLWLSDKAIEKKSKKPETTATIVKFSKINKRPKAPKVDVNYLIGADLTGQTAGEWVVTQKKGTTAWKNGIEIGVADSTNKKVDENGFGLFPEGAKNGIAVKVFEGSKQAKSVYFVRIAPTSTTAASKPVKITVKGEQKPTNYKVNEKKQLLKVKKDDLIFATPSVSKNEKGEISLENYSGTIEIRKAATAKSPTSAKQIVTR